MHQRPPKKFHPVPFAYHQEIELRIDSLTNLGAGVGRVGGWVVFVPFALPGETVRARVYRNDRNCSHADLVVVLEASPDRVEPRCPLFGRCGGCQYQHFEYARQLEWKSRQVAELMEHMAGVSFPVNPCVPSPRQWNYRSKITPHFAKPRDGVVGEIGFLAAGTNSRLVDVSECVIAVDAINRALPGIRADIRERGASFRRGSTLLIRACGEEVVTDFRAEAVERVAGLEFRFLAGDFFQNNPSILPAFTSYVADRAAECGASCVVDAYCGSGLFALSMAARFREVAGVEVSETAVARARRNAVANGISHCRFLAASAEEIFSDIAFPAGDTVVVIDPPRKGCTPGFLGQLLLFRPRRLVYVSCDPATQMRDLRELLSAGYRVADVQPFDLFPHTRHVECVMTLDDAGQAAEPPLECE